MRPEESGKEEEEEQISQTNQHRKGTPQYGAKSWASFRLFETERQVELNLMQPRTRPCEFAPLRTGLVALRLRNRRGFISGSFVKIRPGHALSTSNCDPETLYPSRGSSGHVSPRHVSAAERCLCSVPGSHLLCSF